MNQRRSSLIAGAVVVAACTYNEYNTYNEVGAPDAGAPLGQAGAGQSGRGGSESSGAGSGGSAGVGGAGNTVEAACTGCLRLTTAPNALRNIRLEFSGDENLATAQMTWRVRVRDFSGAVNIGFYAQSGNSLEDKVFLTYLTLNGAVGWQDLGGDFSVLPSFEPARFVDGGGFGGNGFDEGFSFDKTEVERVGMTIATDAQNGVFTPFTIEIDQVRFSGHAELDATFESSKGDIELIGEDGAQTEGATLEHVAD